MTCLLGVARDLAAHRDRWRGTALLIGQPAEERVRGAQAMLDDGLYSRFGKPDYALALHVAADLAAGQVSCRPGYVLANTDSLDITVHGKGGHGAAPHTTVDPIVEAAQLVLRGSVDGPRLERYRQLGQSPPHSIPRPTIQTPKRRCPPASSRWPAPCWTSCPRRDRLYADTRCGGERQGASRRFRRGC